MRSSAILNVLLDSSPMNTAAIRNLVMNGSVRKLIRDLLSQGLGADDVANALNIDVSLVEQFEPAASSDERDEKDGSETEQSETTGLSATEARLQRLSDRAIDSIETLIDGAESEGVRFAASKFALEAANGSLRAKTPGSGGLSMTQINLHITKATERYHEQLRAAGESVDVSPVNK